MPSKKSKSNKAVGGPLKAGYFVGILYLLADFTSFGAIGPGSGGSSDRFSTLC